MHDLEACNRSRFDPHDTGGHYESWFARANHPDRPLAFWIRYTVFAPRGRPRDAVGETWAIWFDGERGRRVALKDTAPLERCSFSSEELDVRIGLSTLTQDHLEGRTRGAGHVLRWQLDYTADETPLLLLARPWYERRFPKAKSLVACPNAQFWGSVSVDGATLRIDGWRGSQNHNWGRAHTDRYAWGQVAGFDEMPHAFLECATAWLKVAGIPLPPLTVAAVRLEGRRFLFNRLAGAMLRSRVRLDGGTWELVARSARAELSARFEAAPESFVALRYDDPPGGSKLCLNSKLAACVLTLSPQDEAPITLVSRQRAALEILGDRLPPGFATVPLERGAARTAEAATSAQD